MFWLTEWIILLAIALDDFSLFLRLEHRVQRRPAWSRARDGPSMLRSSSATLNGGEVLPVDTRSRPERFKCNLKTLSFADDGEGAGGHTTSSGYHVPRLRGWKIRDRGGAEARNEARKVSLLLFSTSSGSTKTGRPIERRLIGLGR